jgi:hypothetical protein
MSPSAFVSYADLEAALDWVSSGPAMENSAFVSRATGATHWSSEVMELENELPEDIEDGSLYVAVPHRNDLNLGSRLALQFTEEALPGSYSQVAGFFRQRGAYGRFKDFLERKNALAAWYEYEAKAVERALREWCEEHGLQLKP